MIKKLLITVMVSLGLFVGAMAYAPTANAGLFDSARNEACGGAQLKGSSADCANADTGKLDNTVSSLINILSIIVGLIAVIMIIINGLKLITSNGDSNRVSSARQGIIYAVVGLIFVALAQVIVKFVINNSK